MPQEATQQAIVATPHRQATGIGTAVLREGGTAIDAAIAANAALTVLLPDQTSIGGDCFMLIWPPGDTAPVGLNGSGRAPMAVDADTLRAQGYGAMPRFGPATVTVPGTVDAWFAAHERLGRLPMTRLLQPAADLARDGFPVSERLAAVYQGFAGELANFPTAASIFLDRGQAPAMGYRQTNPALASSIERIATHGRDEFYQGHIADAILATVGTGNGPMTRADLASHESAWVAPVSAPYRDASVWQMPPSSQGITALLALLMMGREPAGASWDDPAWLHVQIEAKKRAFSIRDRYLADPDAMRMAVETMLASATVDALWSSFDPVWASPGQVTLPGDTIFLGVIDRDGLTVSLIQSIFQAFGSGLIAGDTGIVLQNRGSYFSLAPGHPNELAGGKRPLHTLMPAMIDTPHSWRGPLGTQGGDAQAQVQMQLTSHLIDFGVTPAEALAHSRWLSGDGRTGDPLAVIVEAAMPEHSVAGLVERGHVVSRVEPGWPHAGYAQIALRHQETGAVAGGADPRSEGSVEIV